MGPEAGDALLTGRLTSPMSYSGMGTTVARPDLRLVQHTQEQSPPRRAAKPTAGCRRRRAPPRARRGRRERAAEERRRRQLTEAPCRPWRTRRPPADEALGGRGGGAPQRTGLDERRARSCRREATELADELAGVEEEADLASSQHKAAERRRKTAERRAADATAARDHAQAHLDDLTAGD